MALNKSCGEKECPCPPRAAQFYIYPDLHTFQQVNQRPVQITLLVSMVFPNKPGGLVLLIILSVIFSGCVQLGQSGPVTADGYRDVTAPEARSIKHESEGKLVIIDLSPDYNVGHLPMAISIPLESLDEKIPALDKSRPYLVYSRTDDVSIAGARKMVSTGFSPVYRLKGNYEAWVSAGYPEV